ncbi:hypothetical protein DPX16_22707 [Anabarilius grahami]|uniref:Uncharacterized protein n=1 Tax=Anabarilius grahami TaxID=495550 RepID=A0A3N0XYK8_ANAGA|nr:hypothetical protein DPX16_22707 [Anabarilius grahami]
MENGDRGAQQQGTHFGECSRVRYLEDAGDTGGQETLETQRNRRDEGALEHTGTDFGSDQKSISHRSSILSGEDLGMAAILAEGSGMAETMTGRDSGMASVWHLTHGEG